jgi:DNA replication protein DnaC
MSMSAEHRTAGHGDTPDSGTAHGFAPLDDTGAQLLFRVVAAAYERRALGIASHWPFESWGRFLPEHTTAVSLLDRLLHHANVVVTDGDSYRMRQARARGGTTLNKT